MRSRAWRWAAWCWLALVLFAGGYVVQRLHAGIQLQSSVLALLPRGARDGVADQAQQRVAEAGARRIVLLLGHADPARARAAGHELAAALTASGLVRGVTALVDGAAQQRLGALYFPHRAGLLAEADRAALLAGQAPLLVQRAEAMLFGPAGFGDARLLASDPFLLLPGFFGALPLPQSRLAAEDGQLVVHDGGMTWAFVAAELAGDSFALPVQHAFAAFFAAHLPTDVTVLRTGALFYATAGARQAMGESSTLGAVSLVATVAMILLVFRRIRPILLAMLDIGVGITFASACCLWWFRELHTVALLFGASLIGVAVDYSLQYFAAYFDPAARTARDRLRRVLPGVAIGLGTTLIGYATLLLAPFPGLQQIAAFSVLGLTGSFLTVALWYPVLDRAGPLPHGGRLLALLARHWAFWQAPRLLAARLGVVALAVAAAAAGLPRLHADDNVQHMQDMPADLRRQEAEIQRLTGNGGAGQFLLVRAADAESALQVQEAVLPRLEAAQASGLLAGFQAPAQFVPSVARQRDNAALVARTLGPLLPGHVAAIGLDAPPQPAPEDWLLPAMLPQDGPLALVRALVLDPGTQLVLLHGVADLPALREAMRDAPGIELVSLADDWSALFGVYRRQALWLLALSVLLMLPLLAARYRWATPRVLAPSLLAVLLTPPLAALFGLAFTFFNAMALVLVLSIGVDYAVFCRETPLERRGVTALAILLAALSTTLSFGMLAASEVFAVRAFGSTMLIGIALAWLLAPLAGGKPIASGGGCA